MSKERKITVKHFLHEKMRVFKVNNENHYQVYLQILVTNKLTRIKSYSFTEIYTKTDFEGLQSSEKAQNEIITVQNLIRTQLGITNEFDTNLFSAFYNLMPNYELSQILAEKLLNVAKGSFYNFFSPSNQIEIENALREKTEKMPIMENVNKGVMLAFFEILAIKGRQFGLATR